MYHSQIAVSDANTVDNLMIDQVFFNALNDREQALVVEMISLA